jgi:hypothetical protein
LRTARAAQPETAELEDALEMGKQHLDTFSVAAGLFERHCAGERTGNIAGIFMNAARDLAGRLFGTAPRFARPIQHLVIIHDPSGRGEGFECRTDIDVARLVEGEVGWPGRLDR